MALNKAYSQYRENSIYTSSPEELTLMLYNGLVKYVMQSIAAIEENDLQKAHNSIVRSEDIIQEFIVSLDMKYDVSQNLLLIYDFMYRQLIDANIKKDKETLEVVLSFAKDLRDTWSQAMKLAKLQQPRQQQAVTK